MNPEITEPEEATPTTNAVSLFGQGGGLNDFPVLKAFQQYIDAEQAKARKRMLGLSIFFIVLLVVIVITFTIIVALFFNRNQTLSDRLLDIALREKAPAPAPSVVNVQPPTPTTVLSQHSDEDVERIAKTAAASVAAEVMSKQQPAPVAQPTPIVVTTSPSSVVQPQAESPEVIRLRDELRREKEERKAEQAKAKEEKRQAEIEAHRRRLYPDYYARQDALKQQPVLPSEKPAPVEIPPPAKSSPAPTVLPAESSPAPDAQPAPVPVATSPSPVVQPEAESPEVIRLREELRREREKNKVVQVQTPVAPTALPPKAQSNASPPAVHSPSPTAPQRNQMKPKTYNLADADPELDEILKNLKAAPAPQPAPQPTSDAKPPTAPAVKPAPKPAEKPAAKPAVKPAQQPAAKPAPKPPAKSVPAQTGQQAESVPIDGNSIPWLIETP